jgi:hypothetical protein
LWSELVRVSEREERERYCRCRRGERERYCRCRRGERERKMV